MDNNTIWWESISSSVSDDSEESNDGDRSSHLNVWSSSLLSSSDSNWRYVDRCTNLFSHTSMVWVVSTLELSSSKLS